MVPWPVALLALFYGVVAAMSAANLWKILAGVSDKPVAWALVWVVLSAGRCAA